MATEATVERVFNFSAGPGVLPLPVLERARAELLALPGCGASVMEISHRSKPFIAIMEDAERRLRDLLAIPSHYKVLFLQGGARLQFSMVPLNLMTSDTAPPEYLISGTWGASALEEAQKEGACRVTWDGAATNYDRLPDLGSLEVNPRAAYVHITSNETIQGVQFPTTPELGAAPLVADMSSDFLCRPFDVSRYGLIYACAQKNIGPAGVTIVLIREDLLQRSRDRLPGYLNYRLHAEAGSMWNTPPTFAVYMVGLVARWLQEEVGGLAAMEARNREKAKLLYDELDAGVGFYHAHAQPACRSLMNVTFRLPNADLEKAFLSQATKHRLDALQGHRSVGGVRASIYNAMPLEGVLALRDFMRDFRTRNQG